MKSLDDEKLKFILLRCFIILFGILFCSFGLWVLLPEWIEAEGYAILAFGVLNVLFGILFGNKFVTKIFVKFRLHILVVLSCAAPVALLVIFQKDEAYLYDVSTLHSIFFYIIAAIFVLVTVISLFIKKKDVKIITAAVNVLSVFILFAYILFDGLFCIWVSSSQTSDIENYKKFDVQVISSDENFFPELKENYEVIKYDYYYSYPYHHVYSIYLEIKVNGDIEELLNEYRVGEYEEKVFEYDSSFMEIVYEDKISYVEEDNRFYRGYIKKILYSQKEKIVIFQCMDSWSYCDADEVYYLERFNIDPKIYSSE